MACHLVGSSPHTQGDSVASWSLEPFRMFLGGPLWHPPPVPVDEPALKGRLASKYASQEFFPPQMGL